MSFPRMSSKTPVSKAESILIVGAGVFGLSTALELKRRGYKDVTVLDRYMPPVTDGSSVDISRIIRADYADPLYGKIAREALQGWNTEYRNHFHQSGFVMLAKQPGNLYMEKTQQNARASGCALVEYENASDLCREFPGINSDLRGCKAYVNPQGGWADAEGAIRHLSAQCSLAGVTFITGPRGRVLSLRYEGGRVVGVNTAHGTPLLASQIILATGAWTNGLLAITHTSSASGQPVGFVQLTHEEAKTLANMPVMLNFDSGVFVFPPTPGTNILKLARHGYGFATKVPVEGTSRFVSSPKRDGSNAESSYLPDDADQALRDGLCQLLPDFANREWMKRRLCWYSDTPEGDFIIDHHPQINGLFLATGGSGQYVHCGLEDNVLTVAYVQNSAFKFLPVLGRYIADCFENTASHELRWKWRLRKSTSEEDVLKQGDGSRGGPPLRLLTKTEQAKL